MWCEFWDSQLLSAFLHHVPNYLFADFRSPNHASATNAPKYPTVRYLRYADLTCSKSGSPNLVFCRFCLLASVLLLMDATSRREALGMA